MSSTQHSRCRCARRETRLRARARHLAFVGRARDPAEQSHRPRSHAQALHAHCPGHGGLSGPDARKLRMAVRSRRNARTPRPTAEEEWVLSPQRDPYERSATGRASAQAKAVSRAARRHDRVEPAVGVRTIEEARRRRSNVPSTSDLDGIFAMSPLITAESASEQDAIRAVLDRHRSQLRILTLTEASLSFSDGLPPKHLYWVIAGKVRLFWLGESGGNVTLFVHTVGDVFGELQCGVLDVPVRSLELHVEAVVTRTERSARLLEVGPSAVTELLQNDALKHRLAQSALQRSLNVWDLARFRMLRESGLAIAHLCVTPSCGRDFKYHENLSYRGERLVIDKTATLEDLRRLAGVCENTVRTWLATLERAGYIDRVGLRFEHTRIRVLKPALLVEALELGRLDVSA
jgi:CRP-like cAMP-binding protein